MRVALDRPYPSSLARRMRASGHDAVALAERPADADATDEALRDVLAAERRALVTQNVGDWLPLAAGLPGLVLVDRHRYPRTPLAADKLILALDALLSSEPDDQEPPGPVRWLEPPAGCPFHPAG